MSIHIELSRETDGRWIADIEELPGHMAYGERAVQAVENALSIGIDAPTAKRLGLMHAKTKDFR